MKKKITEEKITGNEIELDEGVDKVDPSSILRKKRMTLSTFLLCFPALIITMLAIFNGDFLDTGIALAMFFFQAVLIKNFIDDHYGP